MKPKDTKPEIVLRDALSATGFEFETHCSDLPGTPDLVFRRERIAVFVHGCFWHGHTCQYTRGFRAKTEGWESRQEETKEKDLRVISSLKEEGWRPIIAWECRLNANLESEVSRIRRFIAQELLSVSTSERS